MWVYRARVPRNAVEHQGTPTELKAYYQVPKVPLYAPSQEKTKNTGAFVKEYEIFHFYIILNAGHMVTFDASEMALSMVNRILAREKMNKA